MAGDPDPLTREALRQAVDSGDTNALAAYMGDPLVFGTAGIRGKVGPGSAQMNRAVVIKTTWGLAMHLQSTTDKRTVVVGFDARPSSRQFAEDTAGVFAAHGFRVSYFEEPTATPIVAYAAKQLEACAAVVVTASHNPPQDNGYKVYGPNAAQIVSPVDTEVQDFIARSPAANEIDRVADAFSGGTTQLGNDMIDSYLRSLADLRIRQQGSDLAVVYTPIHGVGWSPFESLMGSFGHSQLIPVASQRDPDGTFPTVAFPNPEEPGALDRAIDLARHESADLVIANDPDADRLAAVMPYRGEWIPLTGNEMGALLGDYLLANHRSPTVPIVASSIVSSPMMELVANEHGARYERTLTGFKWIVKAGLALEEQGVGTFVYGYEEALGYALTQLVRDKDGLSAALLFTDLVADLRDTGQSVFDHLDSLWRRHGIWVSGQTSIVRDTTDGPEALKAAVDGLAASPPSMVGNDPVTEVTDYRFGHERRPEWLGSQDLVELSLGTRGRMLVRPSGTEPKLKIYVDLRGDPQTSDLMAQREELHDEAHNMGLELAALLAL